jgi:hypothetical protein
MLTDKQKMKRLVVQEHKKQKLAGLFFSDETYIEV